MQMAAFLRWLSLWRRRQRWTKPELKKMGALPVRSGGRRDSRMPSVGASNLREPFAFTTPPRQFASAVIVRLGPF